MARRTDDETESLPLSKATELLLEECRMILPGMQALFGFQLIAAFHPAFHERLGAPERVLHLVAVCLTVLAIALVMTPAAYHRQKNPCEASARFIAVCTRLMLASMVPLAVAISIEFYLVARIVLDSPAVAWLTGSVAVVFVGLWFVLPRVLRR